MNGTSTMILQPTNEKNNANGDRALLERSIADCIARLVHTVERIDDPKCDESIDQDVDQWEDDDFIYLETDSPAYGYIDIDINIHDGRVHIRLAK